MLLMPLESLVLLVLQMSQALLVPLVLLALLALQEYLVLLVLQACCQVPPCNGACGTSSLARCRTSRGIQDI